MTIARSAAPGQRRPAVEVARYRSHPGPPTDPDADGIMTCPWHGCRFDIATGRYASGAQRGDILNLPWAEVQGRKLKLADSKTGPRIVWLGQQAKAVLDGLPRGKKDARAFTFEVQPTSALDWFWRRLRCEAGLVGVRLHDLRHNYASLAARSSETLPMIGSLRSQATAHACAICSSRR